jgi:biotin carboxylase
MTKSVVIVDGSSTGALLAPAFRRKGYECIHVQSAPEPPAVLRGAARFRDDDYVRNVIHDGDLHRTVAALTAEDLLCVVAGVEPAVELADALSHSLSLPGNASATAAARRDKFEMVQALQRAGLRTIPTTRTRSPDEALLWIVSNGGLPAVVKPPKSGGTDGVTLCLSEEDVRQAFMKLLDRRNVWDLVNDALVVQKYMPGKEYVVDTASRGGRHCVTDIWVYGKRVSQNGASFVYDHAWLLPSQGELQDDLCSYAAAALDALGVRYGAAHCEIIVDEAGPVLIEVGARLCGGMVPVLCAAALGSGQLEATVEAYADPDAFDRRAAHPYLLTKQALRVLLISNVEGTLQEFPLMQELSALPSFHDAQIALRPGDHISKTTNFYTHPGKVDLIHQSHDLLEMNMQQIRRWEASGFYRVTA